MLAFVGVLPPARSYGVACLSALPTDCKDFLGFMVRCESRRMAECTVAWYQGIRSEKQRVSLGLVADPRHCFRAVASCPYAIAPMITDAQLICGRVPSAVLQTLRNESVEGTVLNGLVHSYGSGILTQRRTLEALVAAATSGRTIASAARDLSVTPQTIRRRLDEVGISAAVTLTEARVRAYEARRRLGVPPAVALEATGWRTHEARRKTISRLRRRKQASLGRIMPERFGAS